MGAVGHGLFGVGPLDMDCQAGTVRCWVRWVLGLSGVGCSVLGLLDVEPCSALGPGRGPDFAETPAAADGVGSKVRKKIKFLFAYNI